MSDAQTIVLSSEEYRQQQIAQARTEAAGLNLDTTVPGGKYRVGDQWADANGQPIKEAERSDPKPERARG